jgi:hypothetical protein
MTACRFRDAPKLASFLDAIMQKHRLALYLPRSFLSRI